MIKKEVHKVPILENPVRLSDYVEGIFESIPSKKGMKKAIEKKLVKVNGELGTTGKFIRGGEHIILFEAKIKRKKPLVKIDLDVLFEDDYLAIVNKPPGIVVSGNQFRTIENALVYNLEPSTQMDALPQPEPIHRLDYSTGGLLLIGKTRTVITQLNRLFEAREISKTYHAVTIGDMDKKGEINVPIKGKSALTTFEVLKSVDSEKFNQLNLVALSPVSGRRHQLRIHLSDSGNPILGDKKYGQNGLILKGRGLFLCASSLKFQHPVSGEIIDISIELPKKFATIFP